LQSNGSKAVCWSWASVGDGKVHEGPFFVWQQVVIFFANLSYQLFLHSFCKFCSGCLQIKHKPLQSKDFQRSVEMGLSLLQFVTAEVRRIT